MKGQFESDTDLSLVALSIVPPAEVLDSEANDEISLDCPNNDRQWRVIRPRSAETATKILRLPLDRGWIDKDPVYTYEGRNTCIKAFKQFLVHFWKANSGEITNK